MYFVHFWFDCCFFKFYYYIFFNIPLFFSLFLHFYHKLFWLNGIINCCVVASDQDYVRIFFVNFPQAFLCLKRKKSFFFKNKMKEFFDTFFSNKNLCGFSGDRNWAARMNRYLEILAFILCVTDLLSISGLDFIRYLFNFPRRFLHLIFYIHIYVSTGRQDRLFEGTLMLWTTIKCCLSEIKSLGKAADSTVEWRHNQNNIFLFSGFS